MNRYRSREKSEVVADTASSAPFEAARLGGSLSVRGAATRVGFATRDAIQPPPPQSHGNNRSATTSNRGRNGIRSPGARGQLRPTRRPKNHQHAAISLPIGLALLPGKPPIPI